MYVRVTTFVHYSIIVYNIESTYRLVGFNDEEVDKAVTL
jgi:hypothetical protein